MEKEFKDRKLVCGLCGEIYVYTVEEQHAYDKAHGGATQEERTCPRCRRILEESVSHPQISGLDPEILKIKKKLDEEYKTESSALEQDICCARQAGDIDREQALQKKLRLAQHYYVKSMLDFTQNTAEGRAYEAAHQSAAEACRREAEQAKRTQSQAKFEAMEQERETSQTQEPDWGGLAPEKIEEKKIREPDPLAGQKRRRKMLLILAVAVLAVAGIFGKVYAGKKAKNQVRYDAGMELMGQESYEDAYLVFQNLSHKDAERMAEAALNSMQDRAVGDLQNQNYIPALTDFDVIAKYRDCSGELEPYLPAIYESAMEQIHAGDPRGLELLMHIDGYADSKEVIETKQEEYYAEAQKLLSQGKDAEAVFYLANLGDYEDSAETVRNYWSDKVYPKRLQQIANNSACFIQEDGSLRCIGNPEQEGVALPTETERLYSIHYSQDGQLYGVSREGRAVIPERTHDSENMERYPGVVAFALQGDAAVGVRADGTCFINYYLSKMNDTYKGPILAWRNVLDVICTPNRDVAALLADGTVVANSDDLGDLSAFTDVKRIYYFGGVLAGLRNDGTVAVAGPNSAYVKNAESWNGIRDLAISYGEILGIAEDGSILRTSSGPRAGISECAGAQEISFDGSHILALKEDGSIVGFGSDGGEYEDLDYLAGKSNRKGK